VQHVLAPESNDWLFLDLHLPLPQKFQTAPDALDCYLVCPYSLRQSTLDDPTNVVVPESPAAIGPE